MTRLVNFRKERCDVKITRTRKNEIPDPPAEGCFGNPFSVEVYGRDGACQMFRDYFYKRLETDEVFRLAVLQLKGKILGCFCHPLRCHGDTIIEYLEGLSDGDNLCGR